MTVMRDGLATVGNKRVTVRDDKLVVDPATTNELLREVLTELRRLRMGVQLLTDNPLTIHDAEDM